MKPTDILKEHFSKPDRHAIENKLFKNIHEQWIDRIVVVKRSSHLFGLDIEVNGEIHQYEVDTAGMEVTLSKPKECV